MQSIVGSAGALRYRKRLKNSLGRIRKPSNVWEACGPLALDQPRGQAVVSGDGVEKPRAREATLVQRSFMQALARWSPVQPEELS
jgi:hypothetical protein